MGDVDKSLADLDKAIELNPKNNDALNNKAIILNAIQKHEAAKAIYDTLILRKPKVDRYYFNRSFAKRKMQDWEGALLDLNKSLDLNPYNYEAYYNRGMVLQQLNETRAALASFETARRIYPKAFYGFVELGRVYANLGQSRKAISIFNQAIRRNQNNAEAYYLRANERVKQKKLSAAITDLKVARILGYTAAQDKLKQLESL